MSKHGEVSLGWPRDELSQAPRRAPKTQKGFHVGKRLLEDRRNMGFGARRPGFESDSFIHLISNNNIVPIYRALLLGRHCPKSYTH